MVRHPKAREVDDFRHTEGDEGGRAVTACGAAEGLRAAIAEQKKEENLAASQSSRSVRIRGPARG